MKPPPVDPWRTGLTNPAPKESSRHERPVIDDDEHIIGTASSDHPLDWDLKKPAVFPLRAPGQDYTLLIIDAHDPYEAVAVLMRAVQNPTVNHVLTAAGFVWKPRNEAHPTGFVIGTDEVILWQASARTAADGFRNLVQALLRANREERGFAEQLQRLGLQPMMP